MRLKLCGWWDDGDPETLVYFRIAGQGVDWSSQWHDRREFCEDPTLIQQLRDEVSAACAKYGVPADLSSEDFYEWASEEK